MCVTRLLGGALTIALSEALLAEHGGKARTLARLRRSGFPVPEGFVVPADPNRAEGAELGCATRGRVAQELSRLGDVTVAVRSSATDEDTAEASAAGLYESIIGVCGADDVCEAIASCRQSASASRVSDYRRRGGHAREPATGMAVLVQVLIEAEVSGVMFTPQSSGGSTRIESSWGLGLAVVGGAVTPDAFEVGPGGNIAVTIGAKSARTDSDGELHGTKTTEVANEMRSRRTLDDVTVRSLTALGGRVADILGGPQDIEWAIADNTVWIVQSRPVTASLPAMPDARALDAEVPGGGVPERRATLVGIPASRGVVTAHARIVSGPSAFSAVEPGELVICSYTDPAWTPLFSIAAGIVTEVGGTLSHAAIVAREYGIPAVLGVAQATACIADGDLITLDGTAGTITRH